MGKAEEIAALRMREATLRCDVIEAEDTYRVSKLLCAKAFIESRLGVDINSFNGDLKALGGTEDDRKRRFQLAELDDAVVQYNLSALRDLQRQHALAVAELDGLIDMAAAESAPWLQASAILEDGQ